MKILTSDLVTGGVSVYKYDQKLTQIKKFGTKGSSKYVQKFAQFIFQGKSYFILARKGLEIDIFDNRFEHLLTKTLRSNATRNSEFFIKIIVQDTQLRIFTGLGHGYFIPLDKLLDPQSDHFTISMNVNGLMSFAHLLTNQTIILGGKDRVISIFDLKNYKIKWKSKTITKSIQESEPMWIHDIIINNDGFVAATRFGKLLWYDYNISRFPIDEVQVIESPIKHFLRVSNDVVLIGDSFNNVLLFDVQTRLILQRFNVITGAISSMNILPREQSVFNLFVSSQVDGKLRIYQIENLSLTLLRTYKLNTIIPEIMIFDHEYIEDPDEPETKRRRIEN